MNGETVSVKGNKGFTLIEVLIVVIIIAIVSTIAMLSTNLIKGERLRVATQTLLADIQKCRTDAMTTGPTTGATSAYPNLLGCGIRFAGSTSYVLFKFNDSVPAPNGNYQYDDTTEEVTPLTHTLSSNVQMTISPAANNLIVFDRFGFPRQTVGVTWQMLSVTNILLTYEGLANQTKCIAIDTNSIREGSWDGTTCNKL